jgi:hypothetical protein
MNKQTKILLMFLIAAFLFTGLLYAEERDRNVEVRGVFVNRAERPVGERVYLALVIKPFERDGHVTILVPRNDDFMHAARELREGDKVEIGFVRDQGQKWLKRIKIERRTEERRSPEDAHRRELNMHRRELQARLREINQQLKNIERELKGPEREKRVEHKEIRIVLKDKPEHPEMAAKMERLHVQIAELKEAAEHAERQGRYDKADQLRQKVKMLAEKMEDYAREGKDKKGQQLKQEIIHLKEMAGEAKQRGEMEKAENLWAHAQELEMVLKREFRQPKVKKHKPEGPPKMPPIEEQFNNLKAQLKEVLEHRLQQVGIQMKEALAERFHQIEGGFHEFSMHIERLEKELNELRAENEQLRRALRERMQPARVRAPELRERRQPEAGRRPLPVIRDRIRRLEQPQRRDRTQRQEVERRERDRAEREERRLLRVREEREEAEERDDRDRIRENPGIERSDRDDDCEGEDEN